MTTLRLTDGTTTINFTWHSVVNPYYLTEKNGWTPQIAARALDGLNSGYADVVEEIGLRLFGLTAPEALSRLQDLLALCDLADRFGSGDRTVSPVRLQYTPNGGTQLYEALVLGRMADDPLNSVQLRPQFNDELRGYTIAFTLRLVRRGLWLAPPEPAVVSASVNSGAVVSVTFSDHPIPSPVTVTWNLPTLSSGTHAYTIEQQLLLCSDSAADLIVQEAEGYASGARFVSVAAANARGGNYLRFNANPANTDTVSGVALSIPSGLSTGGLFAVYAHGYATELAQLKLRIYLRNFSTIETPWYPFPDSANGTSAPHLLGLLALPDGDPIAEMVLVARGPVTGDQIYLDYLVFAPQSPDVSAVGIQSHRVDGLYWSTNAIEQRVDAQMLTALSPVVQVGRTTGAQRAGLAYQGQAVVWQRGTNLSLVWLAANVNTVGLGSYDGPYRIVGNAAALFATTFSCVRQRAYLVPE